MQDNSDFIKGEGPDNLEGQGPERSEGEGPEHLGGQGPEHFAEQGPEHLEEREEKKEVIKEAPIRPKRRPRSTISSRRISMIEIIVIGTLLVIEPLANILVGFIRWQYTYLPILIFVAFFSSISILAGGGVLLRKEWGRKLTIVFSVFSIIIAALFVAAEILLHRSVVITPIFVIPILVIVQLGLFLCFLSLPGIKNEFKKGRFKITMKKICILFISLILALCVSIIFASNRRGAHYTVRIFTSVPKRDTKIKKVWIKGEKMRKEWKVKRKKIIIIKKYGYEYTYFPEENICYRDKKLKFSDIANGFTLWEPGITVRPELVKSKSFHGHPCDIYEQKARDGSIKRTWVWKDDKFRVRSILEHEGKVINRIDFKDIELDAAIDDELFELPDDVVIKDYPAPK